MGDFDFGNLFPADSTSSGLIGSGVDYTFDVNMQPPAIPVDAYTPAAGSTSNAVSAALDPSTWDLSSIASGVKNLFSTALALNQAYKSAGSPAVRTSSPSTVVNANGTLTTVSTTGAPVTVRMVPGTPYLTSGGGVVTNNGDGTYTTINADGTTVMRVYPATISGAGVSMSTMLLLGGVGLAAYALLHHKG